MKMNVDGVLTDFKGRVLLRRTEANALAPITHALVAGVVPADTLASAFREDTALIVMPVRLTGLYYSDQPPGGELTFCFRCTIRGGNLDTEDQSPAGFFDPPLPGRLPAPYRHRVEQALHHPGGPPYLEREGHGLGARLGRLFGGRVVKQEDATWEITVKLIADGGHGQIIWNRGGPNERWRLPATRPAAGEAPWDAADRLLATTWTHGGGQRGDLLWVELGIDRPEMTFVFAASLYEPPMLRSSSETQAFVRMDEVTDRFSVDDVARIEENERAATPVFRLSSGSGR
jgi:hypothetical protein